MNCYEVTARHGDGCTVEWRPAQGSPIGPFAITGILHGTLLTVTAATGDPLRRSWRGIEYDETPRPFAGNIYDVTVAPDGFTPIAPSRDHDPGDEDRS